MAMEGDSVSRRDLKHFVQLGWTTHVREMLAVSERQRQGKSSITAYSLRGSSIRAQLNNRHGQSKQTVLHLAVSHESATAALSMTRLLLEYGASPQIRDAHGQDPLCLACALGRSKVVERLLEECDVEVGGQDRNGRTPLAHAVMSGDVETVRLVVTSLRNNYLSVDIQDKQNLTPLTLAVREHHKPIVKLLLEEGRALAELATCQGYNPYLLLQETIDKTKVLTKQATTVGKASLKQKKGAQRTLSVKLPPVDTARQAPSKEPKFPRRIVLSRMGACAACGTICQFRLGPKGVLPPINITEADTQNSPPRCPSCTDRRLLQPDIMAHHFSKIMQVQADEDHYRKSQIDVAMKILPKHVPIIDSFCLGLYDDNDLPESHQKKRQALYCTMYPQKKRINLSNTSGKRKQLCRRYLPCRASSRYLLGKKSDPSIDTNKLLSLPGEEGSTSLKTQRPTECSKDSSPTATSPLETSQEEAEKPQPIARQEAVDETAFDNK